MGGEPQSRISLGVTAGCACCSRLASRRGRCKNVRPVRAALVLFVLTSACGRTQSYGKPACLPGTVGTPDVTLQTLSNGVPRVWNRDACIPVTYAPTLEKLLPDIRTALDAWDQVVCTGLCFETPVANKAAPAADLDRRLHFFDAVSPTNAWELLSEGNTGYTLHATIFVSNKSNLGEMLRQVGSVLGFMGSKPDSRDTVMEEVLVPNPRTGLGALDRQSVCAVYPACR